MNGGKEEKIKIDRPVIVEGVYDKCALSSIIDATVITTGGFSVFNKKRHFKSITTNTRQTINQCL